jgi:Fe2+ transport system protein FeoA
VIKEYMNERCSHGKARHLRHRWRNHQRCENMHLLHMGIRIGDEIEVVSNAGNGQLVIACSGNRYVLGNCSSRRLLVERLPN